MCYKFEKKMPLHNTSCITNVIFILKGHYLNIDLIEMINSTPIYPEGFSIFVLGIQKVNEEDMAS